VVQACLSGLTGNDLGMLGQQARHVEQQGLCDYSEHTQVEREKVSRTNRHRAVAFSWTECNLNLWRDPREIL
jgi:hypothetical protein